MEMVNVTKEQIANMSYNELIGLVRETNRPPGGERAIATVVKETFLKQGKKVLEIGTSTGVTAIEIARLSGANVTGIDINPQSLEEARQRAKRFGVDYLTHFQVEDATKMSFADETFDVVFCGNVTSLVSNRENALREYARVLKKGGFLVCIPMYYIKTPSEQLVKDVSAAIKVNITPHDKKYWMDFFQIKPFTNFFEENYAFDEIAVPKVDEFSNMILQREHLQSLSMDAKQTLKETYTRFMQLFRVNLAHMGFTVLVLRKEAEEIDEELFTATKL